MDSEKNLSNQPYLTILSKVSSQITWLTFAILIIIGTNTFTLYQNHFGALKTYLARERNNQNKPDSIAPLLGIGTEDAKEKIKERVRYYEDLDKKSRVITIPILGITLINRDFFILYLIVGIVFLLWLATLLNYSKNFLENILNEYHYPSDSDANAIQALFFIIMPTDYTSKRYAYYELVFISFVISIFLLILSDLTDMFFQNGLYGVPVYKNPSFDFMVGHLIVSYLITALSLVASILLYLYSRTTLKHIRNALTLLRWNRIAFFPALHEFAREKSKPLGEKKNFIEYRACDDSNESKLLILMTHENEKSSEVKAAVDLPHSIRQFYKLNRTSKTEYDEKLERYLTIEESFMRDYFRRILREKLYEPELCDATSKIN